MFHTHDYQVPDTLYGAHSGRFNRLALMLGLIAAILAGPLWPATAQAGPKFVENDDTYVIMAYGDSLMAGYGIGKELAFPAQLERALQEAGYNIKIINASKSGDTSVTGMKRLEWSLRHEPDLVILALGANDALRGIKPKYTRTNLAHMIYQLRTREIDVLLVGMVAPPNMGAGYGAQFNGIFNELSHYYSVPLYPFILHGVAGKSHLNLEDGVHPNPDGVAVMVEGMMPHVERMLPDYVYVDPSLPPRDPAAYGGLDED